MTTRQNHSESVNQKNQSQDNWLRFLEWFCPPQLYEGIEGDVLEVYEAEKKSWVRKKQRRGWCLTCLSSSDRASFYETDLHCN